MATLDDETKKELDKIAKELSDTFICKYCLHDKRYYKKVENHVGEYCNSCHKWQRWVKQTNTIMKKLKNPSIKLFSLFIFFYLLSCSKGEFEGTALEIETTSAKSIVSADSSSITFSITNIPKFDKDTITIEL